jgi:hypothetical protein
MRYRSTGVFLTRLLSKYLNHILIDRFSNKQFGKAKDKPTTC